MRRSLLLLTLMLSFGLMLLLGGCGTVGVSKLSSETKAMRGTMTRLQPAFNFALADQRPVALTVKVREGAELTFRIDERVDTQVWNMRHLNSHLELGEPLVVVYRQTPDGLVAVELQE